MAVSPFARPLMGDEWESEFKLDGDQLIRVFESEDGGDTWTVTYDRM